MKFNLRQTHLLSKRPTLCVRWWKQIWDRPIFSITGPLFVQADENEFETDPSSQQKANSSRTLLKFNCKLCVWCPASSLRYYFIWFITTVLSCFISTLGLFKSLPVSNFPQSLTSVKLRYIIPKLFPHYWNTAEMTVISPLFWFTMDILINIMIWCNSGAVRNF